MANPQAAMAAAMGKLQADLMGPGGEFEMGPVTVRHGPTYPMVFLKGPKTMPEYYDLYFEKFADKDFLVFDGERYTYKRVNELSRAVGATLANQLNIRPGDRVAVSMRNYPEYAISYIAATRMGAVIVPLNSLWKDAEYAYGLEDSGTKLLICDDDRYKMAKASCDRLGVKVILVRTPNAPATAGVWHWDAVVESGKGAPFSNPALDTDDMAGIMYTSGTTGNPKGVVHTQRNIAQQMIMGMLGSKLMSGMMNIMGAPPSPIQPCVILPVPLFHVTGSHHVFLQSMIEGRKMVMMPKWDPLKALQLIEREKCTTWTGVPTMVQDMMEHPDFDKYDVSTMKSIGGGGGPTPAAQVTKVAQKFKGGGAGQGYGLTETNGAVATNGGPDYLRKPTSIGKPFPIVQMQARDVDTGNVLPTGERGELWIKSVLNMKEYFNKPEKSAEVLDKDGWFASGDIGKIDEEGFAYILDRAKDLIIRGGENISCAEVEAAFFETGKVLECAAFGIPDERLSEVVGLMVVPNSAGAGVSANELRSAVVGKIAGFKIPEVQHIFVTSERLPRGATEKILKREIRDSIAQKLGKNQPQSKL